MTQEVQDKMKATNIEKYGVEYVTQNLEIKERMVHNQKEALLEKYGVDHISKIPETREKARKTMLERYGVPWGVQLESYLQGNKDERISAINCHVADEIEKHGLSVEFEFYLNGRL